MTDSTQLQLLADFLRSFRPDAFGRSEEPVDQDVLARIDLVCAGRMSAAEAKEFLAQIATNPPAIERLAERLKGSAEDRGQSQ